MPGSGPTSPFPPDAPTGLRYRPQLPAHPLVLPQPGGDGPSRFAFSMVKAGSTLLFDLLRGIAPAAGLAYFSPEDALFSADVGPDRRPAEVGDVFRPTGYCYGGFRQFPAYPVPMPHDARSVLLVRDPRDMAVSLFHSLRRSHALPPAGRAEGARAALLKERARVDALPIDRFVTRTAPGWYRRMIETYVGQGFLWRPDVAIFRYEDVVFDKERWLGEICRWFGWAVDPALVRAVADRHDERPAVPRPDRHVRAVTPGAHRRELSPAAIRRLDESFAEYLGWFGYG